MKQKDCIVILDFGSQTTQLIARRVRELGVYCEIFPYYAKKDLIINLKPKGIILSGGPETVTKKDTPKIQDYIFELSIPILGICYGMQALAMQLGGHVLTSDKREFGDAKVYLNKDINSRLFEYLYNRAPLDVWMSHGDKVDAVPEGFNIIASSDNCNIAAMENVDKKYYGLQFHPEVTHTIDGSKMLANFLFEVCNCQANWNSENIIADLLDDISKKVGVNEKVILGLSGGVDSAVVAALLHEAIGDRLVCVFVDTGLLRLNERSEIEQIFKQNKKINLIVADAKEQFLSVLKGITDPEEKRKIIGREFIKVFDQESHKIDGIKFLAQGTIYPDVIESAASETGAAHVIKSHHNVGGLPDVMKLKLLEPLRNLFKDEVRKIGLALGLPEGLILRHPFPGPGLAVRVLGEIKEEYLDILRKADDIFISVLREENLYNKVNQAFAVFLPVKSVAVLGDARSYEYVICLRSVNTTDFMTATWSYLPYEVLGKISNRIINEVKGVSRVTYDISNKPPATIEWE